MKNLVDKTRLFLTQYKTLRFIILVFLLSICGYLMIGRHIFVPGEVSLAGNIILGVLSILGFVFFNIIENYKGYSKYNVIGLIAISILFVVMVFTISLTPGSYELTLKSYSGELISADIEITTNYKVSSIFNYSSLLICIYLLVFVVPQIIAPRGNVLFVAICVYLTIVFASCLYSLITEFDNYIEFLRNISNDPQLYATKSFFPHRNNWGLFLLISMYFSTYLSILTSKKWILLFPAMLFIFMIFSFCKTSLIVAPIMMLSFAIYYLVITFNGNKKRNIIIISSLAGVIVVLVLVLLLSPLKELFMNLVIGKGGDSLDSRVAIWNKVFQMNSSFEKVLFGTGYGILSKNLFAINNADIWCSQNWGTFKAHNMYVQTYGDGGIILFLAFIIALGYLIFKTVKHYKNDSLISFTILVGIIALMSMWFFES